jgi:hypothetical protein
VQRERVDSLIELAATIAGKADEIEDIVVLYTVKGKAGAHSMENGCTIGEALFLIEAFRHWLMTCVNTPEEKP